jgi:hypothetical protein
MPELGYIEGIRSSGYIKASPCDSALNILLSAMTCDSKNYIIGKHVSDDAAVCVN